MTIANAQDVATDLGRPLSTEAQIAQLNEWLARIERDIRRRYPDFDDRVMDTGWAAAVRDVEVSAVARKARNPDGLRSTSQTRAWDDYSETDSTTTDQELSAGDLALTPAEWDRLAGVGNEPLFTIRAYGEPDQWW
jgi:hypothetical protein